MQDEVKVVKRIETDLEPTLKVCRGLSLLKLPFVPNQTLFTESLADFCSFIQL